MTDDEMLMDAIAWYAARKRAIAHRLTTRAFRSNKKVNLEILRKSQADSRQADALYERMRRGIQHD